MDYLDMLKGLADEDGEVDPQEAKSILNGARDRLEALESEVQDRLPESAGASPDRRRKSKSEISRSERADLYSKWRDEGKDPNEEWAQLPE